MYIEKIGMRNALVDLPQNKVTFLDARFYQLGEKFIPSVTTILEAYPKGAAYYEWLKKNGEDSDTIRDEAGKRGSVVHDMTERYERGEEVSLFNENGGIDYKLSEWAMFERFVEFTKRFTYKIAYSEQNFISEELGYAGTVDRVIDMDGKLILVDIKTSGAIYPSYWLQLAAYKELIEASLGQKFIDEVAILWLNAKTRTEGKKGDIQGAGWQMVRREDTTKDLELFKATHQLWLAENGGSTPKQTTYSLIHKK